MAALDAINGILQSVGGFVEQITVPTRAIYDRLAAQGPPQLRDIFKNYRVDSTKQTTTVLLVLVGALVLMFMAVVLRKK
jgi:hypothetical protein